MNSCKRSMVAALAFGVVGQLAFADAPPVTDGLVMRIDASDTASVKRDDTGLVYEWQDLADPSNCFTTNDAWFAAKQKWFADSPHAQPYYDATAFGGKGGVRFGWCRETGSYTNQGLASTQRILTNRTIFVVFRQDPEASATTSPYFNSERGYVLSRIYGSGWDASLFTDSSGKWQINPGRADPNRTAFWHSCRCLQDGSGYCDSARTKSSTVTNPFRTNVFESVAHTRGDVELVVFRNPQVGYIDAYSGLWVGNKTDPGLMIGRCGAQHGYGQSYFWGNRMFHGWIAEELSYDRVLTDLELLHIQEWLVAKWNVDCEVVNYSWTGKAGTSRWSDANNWSPVGVPVSCEACVILGTDPVTTDGNIGWWRIFCPDSASLAIGAGTVINVNYDRALEIPTCATLSGAITNSGTGLLRFAAANGDYSSASLHLKSGRLDLQGNHLTFRAVTGGDGTVCNSSSETATLELKATAEAPATLSAQVCDKVDVVKTGSGEWKLNGFLQNEGETQLESGKTTIREGEESPSFSGMSIHLDASDLSTISTNADGTVWAWRDAQNNGNLFTTNALNFKTATFPSPTLPWYDPEAFGGKGAVRFGWNWTNASKTEGEFAPTFLTSRANWRALTNKTVFVVCVLDPNAANGSTQHGRIIGWHHTSGFDSGIAMHGSGEWLVQPTFWSGTISSFSLNGVVKIDGWRGVTNANSHTQHNWGYGVPALSGGVVQLLAFRDEQNYQNSYTAFWVPSDNTEPLVIGRCATEYSSWIQERLAGWIGEIISFDRVLTDDEYNRMQRYLMQKWNVTESAATPPKPQHQLSSSSTLALEQGAVLDLNGVTQTVAAVEIGGGTGTETIQATNGTLVAAALTVKVSDDRSVPCLNLDAGWDLTGMTLTLTGARPILGSVLLTAASDGQPFVGPFAESGDWRIRYSSHSVKLSGGGLMILFR